MKFVINPPRGWKEWTIYVLLFKFAIDFAKWLFNKRGSSYETKQQFEITNQKIQELKEAILTKEDFRKIIREENKGFITKDLFEERIERVKAEIVNDYNLKFVAIENLAKRQMEEARGMKQQLRSVFEPMIKEYHKLPKNSKIKKIISNDVKGILDNYEK